MALLDIPLDAIGEQDLQRLIATGAAESLSIDYKRETYGSSDSNHVEFLADLASFANTLEGDVVIGITEAKGVPESRHIDDACIVQNAPVKVWFYEPSRRNPFY
ncbi:MULTISPECIES: RNA-binding domain-containing protein [unclassified Bradyrhizobium]|uniref:RNA-binding domain-containing protein n=1 Tax=unclassified Bradyrhizobium TaxID=2631580 RepID=UPI00291650CC|nr:MULTISPECIES: RNA-binding domain-containing protein [unclassified Bradyrhizobium]